MKPDRDESPDLSLSAALGGLGLIGAWVLLNVLGNLLGG